MHRLGISDFKVREFRSQGLGRGALDLGASERFSGIGRGSRGVCGNFVDESLTLPLIMAPHSCIFPPMIQLCEVMPC